MIIKDSTYKRLKSQAKNRGRKTDDAAAIATVLAAGAIVGIAMPYLQPQLDKVKFIKDNPVVVPAVVTVAGVAVALVGPDVTKPVAHAAIGAGAAGVAVWAKQKLDDKKTAPSDAKGIDYREPSAITSARRVFALQAAAQRAPQRYIAAPAQPVARRRSALMDL